jgi:hypothetical protein
MRARVWAGAVSVVVRSLEIARKSRYVESPLLVSAFRPRVEGRQLPSYISRLAAKVLIIAAAI